MNRVEGTFLTVATQSQGSIITIAGPDFSYPVNETMWNRSQRRPVPGPLSPQEWQLLQAQFSSGPWLQYTIRGNQLLFFPVPTAGQSVFFEWISKFWCTSATGTGQTAMVLDTDVSDFDERLHVLGGLWRFKKENHLEYEEDFNAYEDAVNSAITRDGGRKRINMGNTSTEFLPAIVVPAGNWGVP